MTNLYILANHQRIYLALRYWVALANQQETGRVSWRLLCTCTLYGPQISIWPDAFIKGTLQRRWAPGVCGCSVCVRDVEQFLTRGAYGSGKETKSVSAKQWKDTCRTQTLKQKQETATDRSWHPYSSPAYIDPSPVVRLTINIHRWSSLASKFVVN